MKKIFGKLEEAHDAIFTEVSTSIEFNVEEKIKEEVKQAVQATIDKCSKEYYRTIDVDFKLKIK